MASDTCAAPWVRPSEGSGRPRLRQLTPRLAGPPAELIADDAAEQLRQRGVRFDSGGVQAKLNAALKHEPKLRAVVRLLAERHHERPGAVEEALRTLYGSLSVPFHATGNEVLVRQLDFSAGTLRCGVCALLEWRHLPYRYYDKSDTELLESPYKLSAEDRAKVAAMAATHANSIGGGGGDAPAAPAAAT